MSNEGFYDFHTHTVFSDGGMIPAGLMQRALVRGCLGLAITDHVDSSNLEWAFENLLKFVEELGKEWQPDIVPGGDGTAGKSGDDTREEIGAAARNRKPREEEGLSEPNISAQAVIRGACGYDVQAAGVATPSELFTYDRRRAVPAADALNIAICCGCTMPASAMLPCSIGMGYSCAVT